MSDVIALQMGGEWRSNGESLITSTEYKSMMVLTASGAEGSIPLPGTPRVREQLAVVPPSSTAPSTPQEERAKQEHVNSVTLDGEIAY